MPKFIDNEPVGGYHGVTAHLDTLQAVCDYEEKKIELNTGYPRFVTHPEVRQTEQQIKDTWEAHAVLAFCSFESALFAAVDYFFNKGISIKVESAKAQKIIETLQGMWGRLLIEKQQADIVIRGDKNIEFHSPQEGYILTVIGDEAAGFVVLHKPLLEELGLVRRNIGFNLSSRRAERRNKNLSIPKSDALDSVKHKLIKLEESQNCFLLPSGMAAVFVSILSCIEPQRTKIVCIGNVYVDTLCILENWPSRKKTAISEFILDVHDKQAIQKAIDDKTAVVICEVPTNPLLDVPDINAIVSLAHSKGAKVIIDSTVATPANIHPLKLGADIVVHSTTKFLNGRNDHMGGVLFTDDIQLTKKAASIIKTANIYMDIQDATVLNTNLDGFQRRMVVINKNGKEIAGYLRTKAAKTYYPKKNAYLKAGSGLISFVLTNSNKERAALFYDNLTDPIIRGPSLGAEQTLLCPYTLLAHYQCTDAQLKELGLDRYLFRISVGTEPVEKIKEALQHGFDALGG